MLEDGLSYPFNSENALIQHLIGGALWFFSWLLIPLVLIAGYYMDAMRAILNGNDSPPSFGDWGTYFRDGLFGTIVALVYSFIPLAIMIGVMLFTGAFGTATGSGTASAGIMILSMLFVFLLSLISGYILPGAIVHVVREGTPSAAFRFGELKQLWTSSTYLVAYLVYFIGGFAAGLLFTVFAMVTFGIGYLLYPFFLHYYYLFGAYVFAKAYRDVYDTAGHGTSTTGTGNTAEDLFE